ncbi:uncharacterized protein LOC134266766 [Saccostrea cucullata]|uniref:uncharacterized protein LOC134266766 n=1 Tax=Saccostrea cuccullata TaxID=36930 RepID=UPI002ED2B52D
MPGTKKGSEKSKSERNETVEITDDLTIGSLKADLLEIKECLQQTVKTCDLESMVTNIVKGLLKIHEANAEKRETLLNKRIDNLTKDVDRLTMENETLKEKLSETNKNNRELKKEMDQLNDLATFATVKANYNEQYSRKNNIKVYGVQETEDEDIIEVVKSVLKEKGDVEVNECDIVACHRIPGSKGKGPKPILMKMTNNDKKAHIMRKRSKVKAAPGNIRLGDDVTKENGELIARLLDCEGVSSAWYFNGSVYGEVKKKRVKFDILDDIAHKVNKIRD